jgi:type IV pilus assembly protein PilP
MNRRRAAGLALFGLLLAAACDQTVSAPTTSPPNSQARIAAAQNKVADDTKKNDIAPPVQFQETDFAESERSRDPFRSFANAFAEEARTRVKSQREVVLDQYTLDELKLVGIVTRIQPERALLIDPTGKGHIVTRGQFVGRAEVVQGGTSGADYEINWRVERIRDTDVVFVRDDPNNPDVPSATRIVALRPEPVAEQ